MRLKKAQKEALITWVAEGLESDEINKRAAKFKPRFHVSRQQVHWYRKSREVTLQEIQEAGEVNALKSGFAVREKRVEALKRLADVMLAELTRESDNLLWTSNAKGIGSGDDFERYDYKEFNKAEVDALRGVLDDIALEVGERVRRSDLTSGGKPLLSPEAIVERVNLLLQIADERRKNNAN